jgi:hypothetical protein
MNARTLPALVAAFLLGLLTARLGRGETPTAPTRMAGSSQSVSCIAEAHAPITGHEAAAPQAQRESALAKAPLDSVTSAPTKPWRALLSTVLEELGDEWIWQKLARDIHENTDVHRAVLRTILSSENPDLIEACGRVLLGETPDFPACDPERLQTPEEQERTEAEEIALRAQVRRAVESGANPTRQYWLAPLVGEEWRDPDSFPIVRKILNSGDPILQARMLKRMWVSFSSPDPSAVTPEGADLMTIMKRLAGHDSIEIRSRALQVVAYHVPRDWWKLTADAMFRDPSSEVRRAAIEGLAINAYPADSLRSLGLIAKDADRSIDERRAAAHRILDFLRTHEQESGALTSSELADLRRLLGMK